MISILNQIAKRAKKLLLLLIIIPLVTGAVSYYLESKKITTYTASTTIDVGNFNNEWIATPTEIESKLKTEEYLKLIKEVTNGEFDFENVKSRFVVTSPSTTEKGTVKFQYSGTDEKEVKATLHDLADGYEMIRNEEFSLKQESWDMSKEIIKLIGIVEIEKAVNQDKLGDVAEFAKVNQELGQVIYRETKVLDPVSVITSFSNPLKRALFGIILGLMLNVVILVTPELFREYR